MKKALLFLLAMGVLPLAQAKGRVNDFPTQDRVEYVLECARDANGKAPPQEYIYKCTCVIDAIAEKLTYEQYVEYSTSLKAFSIGGERGEQMRSDVRAKDEARKLREIQADARKRCFLQ